MAERARGRRGRTSSATSLGSENALFSPAFLTGFIVNQPLINAYQSVFEAVFG
jgi:hypothetical protein